MDHSKLKFIYTVIYYVSLIIMLIITAIGMRVNIIRYEDNYIMIFLSIFFYIFAQQSFIRIGSYLYQDACRELEKESESK